MDKTVKQVLRHGLLVTGCAAAILVVGASHPEAAPMPGLAVDAPTLTQVDATPMDTLQEFCDTAEELGEHAGDQAEKRHDCHEQADILAEDRAWRLAHEIVEPA